MAILKEFWALIVTAVFLVAGGAFGWYEAQCPGSYCPSDPVHCAVSENPPKPVISQHETRPQPVKPRRITRPRPVNCRWVPAQAYQWPEGTVLSYAQQNYRLTPTQLRVLKYCVEHHHG